MSLVKKSSIKKFATQLSENSGPLERSVAILRLLATAGRRGLALTVIAKATGLANSTIHRLLNQLVNERLAMQIEDSRQYAIGPLAYELGLAAAQQFDIRSSCRFVLESLAKEVGETVYLVLRSGDEAVCIDLVEGASPVRVVTLQVGSRRPLGLGAGGLAILAGLPIEDESRLLHVVSPRIELEWGFQETLLKQSLEETRRNGYSTVRNRINPGVTAIGFAFRDSLGQVLGAISIAATNARMKDDRFYLLSDQLKKASLEIEQALRGRHWARYVEP